MEKYRKYADAGTGCNPFLPIHLVQPKSEDRVSGLVRCSVLSLTVLVRAPLLAVAIILTGIADVLSFIPVISTLLVMPVVRPLICCIALLLLGVVPAVPIRTEDFRRLKMKRPAEGFPSSTVVLSSFHGLIDVLVHAVTTRPREFVFPTQSGGVVSSRTVLGAISLALKSPIGPPKWSTVSSIQSGSLLFVSPSPTNGLGILKFDDQSLSHLLKGHRVQIHSIQYSGRYGPHHLVEPLISHIFKLMTSNLYATAVVKRLPEPVLVNSDDQVPQLRSLMSRLSLAAETEVAPSTYLEFLAYWKVTQSLTYAKRK